MPFDSPENPKPRRPRNGPGVFIWPGVAYFVIAVLVGAIVARLTHLWQLGYFSGFGHS